MEGTLVFLFTYGLRIPLCPVATIGLDTRNLTNASKMMLWNRQLLFYLWLFGCIYNFRFQRCKLFFKNKPVRTLDGEEIMQQPTVAKPSDHKVLEVICSTHSDRYGLGPALIKWLYWRLSKRCGKIVVIIFLRDLHEHSLTVLVMDCFSKERYVYIYID